MSDKSKNKIKWPQYVAMAFLVLVGAVCGFWIESHLDTILENDMPLWQRLMSLLLLVVGIYVAVFVQLIIHEAGHLVFGLLSGYRFSSFRILSFMWVKECGVMKFKRLSIAGTSGQCLMTPPDLVNGRIPVTLYNLGGSIMNIIVGVVFLGLYFATASVHLLSVIFQLLALIGFLIAFTNGVPMRLGTVDNDGYNAFSLSRHQEALRSFWIQMKVNEQVANGVRLKDMPDEWFAVPDDEAMKNSMVAAVGVFACGRLMDAHHFEEADRLMAHLLAIDSGMVGLHRSMMICDRIYIELMTGNRREVLDGMLTEKQKSS